MITENLKDVEARVCAACERSGRKREDVTLIAVSKTKPVEMLEEAYAYGCRYFGENKVQELDEKYDIMPKDIHWQMIGHLQRNKVKYIIDKAELIHSVDSIRLAETIDKEAAKKGIGIILKICNIFVGMVFSCNHLSGPCQLFCDRNCSRHCLKSGSCTGTECTSISVKTVRTCDRKVHRKLVYFFTIFVFQVIRIFII